MNNQTKQFSGTRKSWLYMVLTLVGFGIVVLALINKLIPIFLNSPYLSSLIVLVFIIGIFTCFAQLRETSAAISWINKISNSQMDENTRTPVLVAPLSGLMRGNQLPSGMSTASSQSILDSIATRMDETRDITRYLVNLLIFLGLLGTFFGLATTIPAVVDTIRALGSSSEGTNNMLSDLMSGLETQLSGMGTAFGSSLIGLSGSLVVGLLDLFAGHGQNRFYREFEEWLSSFTSVGLAEKGFEIDPSEDTPLAKAFRALNDTLLQIDSRLDSQTHSFERIETAFENFSQSMKTNAKLSDEMRQALRSMEAQLAQNAENTAISQDNQTRALHRDLVAIQATLQKAVEGNE